MGTDPSLLQHHYHYREPSNSLARLPGQRHLVKQSSPPFDSFRISSLQLFTPSCQAPAPERSHATLLPICCLERPKGSGNGNSILAQIEGWDKGRLPRVNLEFVSRDAVPCHHQRQPKNKEFSWARRISRSFPSIIFEL